jgi:hypothetical protein
MEALMKYTGRRDNDFNVHAYSDRSVSQSSSASSLRATAAAVSARLRVSVLVLYFGVDQ